MFNIGMIELLIIVFFLVLFVKPEDIPKISSYIGLFYRKINGYIFNIKHELTNIQVDEESEKLLKVKNKNKND